MPKGGGRTRRTTGGKKRTLATRPATDRDFDFAWEVYVEAVRPVIEPKLDRSWDDAFERERFRETWDAATAHVIALDDEAIGWGAVTESQDRIVIDHFYIREHHRGRGYGATLLSELRKSWTETGKAVHASLVKDSRLIGAAERFGFERTQEDDLVQEMVLRL